MTAIFDIKPHRESDDRGNDHPTTDPENRSHDASKNTDTEHK